MPSPMPVLSQQDFSFIPLLNVVVETLANDPAVPVAASSVGRVYRNGATARLRWVRDVNTIVNLDVAGLIADADIAAGAGIALAKLSTNPLARTNHTGTQVVATISDFATAVAAFRLDQFAAPTAALNINGQRLTAVADPTAATDATTQQWVQNLINARVNGQDWKASVRVRTSAVNLASPGASVDGVAMNASDRVLVTDGTAASGVYVWNGSTSTMTRDTDADTSAKVTTGMTVPVSEGTSADTIWLLTTNDPLVLGTTALAFTQIGAAGASYTAGAGLSLTGNVFSLPTVTVALGGTGATTVAAARTNLGLGRAGAVLAVPALVAGVEASLLHALGTQNCNIDVRRISDRLQIPNIGARCIDATHVGITADIAVTAGTLEVLVGPVD